MTNAAHCPTPEPHTDSTVSDELTFEELHELHVADRLVIADLKAALHRAERAAESARLAAHSAEERNKSLSAEAEQLRNGARRSDGSTGAGTPAEIDDLRAEVARLAKERDQFRLRLQQQYDLRWNRLGAALREARRRPTRMLGLRTSLRRRTSPPSPDPPIQKRPSIAERAAALLGEGRHEEALHLLEEGLAKYPLKPDLLEQKRRTLIASGELSAALATARLRHRVDRSDAALTSAEQISGRLRDLNPMWYPDLGPRQELGPHTSNRVLHLLKESLPYQERGYTMRSRYALLSQLEVGLDPCVVTSLGFPRTDGFELESPLEHVDGIPHFRLDLGANYPYRHLALDESITTQAWMTERVVRQMKPAAIHANSGYRGFEAAVVAMALRRRFGIPVAYDVRSFLESTWTGDIERSEQGQHYRMRLAREVQCMQEADLVFTIAETMRDEIIDRGIDPDKIVVIPNAVDPDQFTPCDRDTSLARRLGLNDKVVLGYVSNIGHREGIDVLLRAMKILARDRDDAACLVVGDGPELEGLGRLRTELGLGDRVVLTGAVPHDQISRYYSLIDVFVIPRRDDRAARLVTPLKPFEAMAMGLPLAVSDLPALTEVACPGERGVSFVPEQPTALAAAVEPLLNDRDLRVRLGAEGRRWVRTERTWAANGRRYVEAYARLGVRPERRA